MLEAGDKIYLALYGLFVLYYGSLLDQDLVINVISELNRNPITAGQLKLLF